MCIHYTAWSTYVWITHALVLPSIKVRVFILPSIGSTYDEYIVSTTEISAFFLSAGKNTPGKIISPDFLFHFGKRTIILLNHHNANVFNPIYLAPSKNNLRLWKQTIPWRKSTGYIHISWSFLFHLGKRTIILLNHKVWCSLNGYTPWLQCSLGGTSADSLYYQMPSSTRPLNRVW